MRHRLGIALLVLAVARVAAAPLERDLGMGLLYRRVHALPADLPSGEPPRKGAFVLDLRYVRGDAAAATALAGWVKFHASRTTPLILLANGETEPALLAPFASPDSAPGLIIIGPSAPGFDPDIAVRVSAKNDRRAYDALEKGAPIESLLVDKRAKPRSDEASLERERLSDADPDESAPKDGGPAAPAPVLDIVLQRAVQLHRSLLALKRL